MGFTHGRVRSYIAFMIIVGVILASFLTGCGGNSQLISSDLDTLGNTETIAITSMPTGLPFDGVQPWESVDADGLVVPAERGASSINADTSFVPGVERYNNTGTATEDGEVLRLETTSGETATAVYRVPMGSSELGAVCIDANLLNTGEYYIGLSNYDLGAWEWFGPAGETNVRACARKGVSYKSGLGNLYICILVMDGSDLDIVGVGVNTRSGSDETAPPTPSSPVLTPVCGGIYVQWLPVDSGDLAGYNVYFSNQTFVTPNAPGVQSIGYLKGHARHLIETTSAKYIGVSAVDINGNESALSTLVNAAPLTGIVPALTLNVDTTTARLGADVNLSVTGADSYSYDADGDGIFEITDSSATTIPVNTMGTGLIRPMVKGTSADGTCIALGSISLVVTANSRPVASAMAEPGCGLAPLDVDLTGMASTDFDGEIVGAGWDYNGDGIYDVWESESVVHLSTHNHTYTDIGLFNTKLRVMDDKGSWDVDTVSIDAKDDSGGTGPGDNDPPTAALTVSPKYITTFDSGTFDATASTDTNGTIVKYEWDFDGDGCWDSYGPSSTAAKYYNNAGVFTVTVQVTDDDGATDTATGTIRVNPKDNNPIDWYMFGGNTMHTRRSIHVGAKTNNVKWQYTSNDYYSSAAIGLDGTVYIGSNDSNLHALDGAGGVIWSYNIGWSIQSSPAIGKDGTIYVGGTDSQVHAVNPDGTNKWVFTKAQPFYSSPVIGDDGVIYIGCVDNFVYAINPDGTQKWEFETGDQVYSSPALGRDGTVYIGSYDDYLYALNPVDGSEIWKFHCNSNVYSSPAVGPDGTIYIGCNNNKLFAVNPDGTELWNYTAGGLLESSPAIGADGVIYICSRDSKLYAVNPDGTEKWTFTTGDEIRSSPAVDKDNIVYFGSLDDKVYAVSPDGTELWSYTTGGDVFGCPTIGPSGIVYIGSNDDNVYAFGQS